MPGSEKPVAKQTNQKDEQLERLRKEYGDKWTRENAGRLELEWEWAEMLGLTALLGEIQEEDQ